jgi:hypothetical protein
MTNEAETAVIPYGESLLFSMFVHAFKAGVKMKLSGMYRRLLISYLIVLMLPGLAAIYLDGIE